MILKDKPAATQAQNHLSAVPLLEHRNGPDPILGSIHSAWKMMEPDGKETSKERYDFAFGALQRTDWTSEHVEAFCLSFHRLSLDPGFSTNMGVFLSALVNNAHGVDVIIRTGGSDAPIENLGFMNTRNVVFLGDVGESCCHSNLGGSVIVHGNAGDGLGTSMQGGKLILSGHGGLKVGNEMSGGEIHLNGGYDSLGHVEHGRIYHRGRLILER
jgi:hypothetical protein